MNRLTRLLEAALFAAAEPLTVDELRKLDPEATREEIRSACDELRAHYQVDGHGVEVVEVAEGYQILTKRDLAEDIARAHIVTRPRRLSAAALETLAIIAYRQPTSRAEIEDVRGVSVEGVLRLLLERRLIEVVARGEGVGRPLLYGTTPQFLELLGLKRLSDLPSLDELSVALRSPEFRGEA